MSAFSLPVQSAVLKPSPHIGASLEGTGIAVSTWYSVFPCIAFLLTLKEQIVQIMRCGELLLPCAASAGQR